MPTNCGSGVLPAVLAITDRDAVLSVRGAEDQTGSSAASSAEAGRGQPENSSLVADLAEAKSNSGISWAKSYNLAWRRATTSSAKKNKQQDAGHRMGPGLLIAVVETIHKETDGEGNDGLVRQQPPLFFAVAEKFSVSVMFSKIQCVQINGHTCLQWVYEESNCVESTLFFLSFHGACVCRGLHMRVGYAVLSPDMSHLMLPGWRTDADDDGEIRVASVLPLVNHVFVMTAECHPSAAKSGKPQSGRKPSAKASKRKPQAKQAGRKRKDAPEEDANEADMDPPNLMDYIEDDDNFIDDVEIATDAEDSDDDNAAKNEMQEINEASAAAATDPARLPSSKTVFAVAEDIHRNAELVPEAAVEEEALLLLVRRARSQKAKTMGVGCRSPGHILPGEDSTQPHPHMSSQLPEESGALMGEGSLASQHQPVDAEGVLGESDARSGADVSASDNESDLEAELPRDLAAVLRSKAMVDLQRDGRVLKRWVVTCHLMLEAMHEYAKTKDVLLGTDRSISLVHGLVGRQGREVKLDDDGKVLFSVADCTMYRTGISNGIGYPELCLDDRHAHVLLPSVRAAMRKVKRTDPDRDAVSPHFLRLRDFCEHMLTSISQSTNLTTDDEIPDEDRTSGDLDRQPQLYAAVTDIREARARATREAEQERARVAATQRADEEAACQAHAQQRAHYEAAAAAYTQQRAQAEIAAQWEAQQRAHAEATLTAEKAAREVARQRREDEEAALIAAQSTLAAATRRKEMEETAAAAAEKRATMMKAQQKVWELAQARAARKKAEDEAEQHRGRKAARGTAHKSKGRGRDPRKRQQSLSPLRDDEVELLRVHGMLDSSGSSSGSPSRSSSSGSHSSDSGVPQLHS
eukprot:s6106_g3.t1